jgi:hypothetical protein
VKTLEIDVIKLYAGKIKNLESTAKWNRWLRWCLTTDKLDELISVRKGIQMGMATTQRKGLVTEQLAEMFCRWTGSIEATMRKIIKRRDRLANDHVNNPFGTAKSLSEKRARDVSFEEFLRKKGY